MKKTCLIILAALVLTIATAAVPPPSLAGDGASRISANVVKALLGNAEVVILDVRRGSDYEGSDSKIKGAVRESEKDISWSGKYPKDKILVLYCA